MPMRSEDQTRAARDQSNVADVAEVTRKTRSHKGSWHLFLDQSPLFSDAFTLDPSQVDDAWSKLNTNTWAVEFNNLPLLIHTALVNTLKRSKVFGEKG